MHKSLEEIFPDDMPTIEKIPLDTTDIEIDSITNDLRLLSQQSTKKKLPNQTESIKTFCRIRPFNGVNEIFIIKPDDDRVLQINMDKLPRNQALQKLVSSYTFSKTFGEQSTQIEVFEATCKQIADDLLFKMKSGLIFTYGITNAGKTFTVTGTSTSPGILPLSLQYLLGNFNKVKSNCVLYCNFVEIYQEDVFDLLANDPIGKNKFYKKKLNVKENYRNIFYLSDATYLQLDTLEDFNAILNKGIAKKVHSATNLNQNSSRSHTIFKIILRDRDIVYDDPNILDVSLSIVDLAGAERANRSETTGKELQEACKINQSLSVLGKCLEAMKHNSIYTQKKMVPFRESKLTKLFCEYFQGEQNIIMITNINPRKEDFEETLRALNYSCIAKEIKPIKSRIINNNPLRKIIKVNNSTMNNNSNCNTNNNKSKESDYSSSNLMFPLSNASTNCQSESNESIDSISENIQPNNNALQVIESNDTISNLILEIQKLRSEVCNMSNNAQVNNNTSERGRNTYATPINSNNNNYNGYSNSNSTNHNYNNDSNCNQLLPYPYEQYIQQQMTPRTNNYNQIQNQRDIMESLPKQRMPGVNLFFINSRFNGFNLAKSGLIPEENESEEEDSENEEDDEMQYQRKPKKKDKKKKNKQKKQKKKEAQKRNKSVPNKTAKKEKTKPRQGRNKKRCTERGTSVKTPENRILIPQAYGNTEVFNSTIQLNNSNQQNQISYKPEYISRRESYDQNEDENRENNHNQRNEKKDNNNQCTNYHSIDNKKSDYLFRTQPQSKFLFLNGF